LEAIVDLCCVEFDVIQARGGEAALLLLEQHDVSAVVADQRMPGMTGTELLVHAARLRPDATRVLLTGYSDLDAVVRAINEGGVYHYATKPWDPDELVALLRRAVERHDLVVESRRIVAMIAGHPPEKSQATQLARTAADLELLMMKQDNERLRTVLGHFQDSFWHLRKIQEVLPLCMNCGQARDEQGQWLSLPAYLQRHAAFLSHGYCPTCEALLDLAEPSDSERSET
jgi:response regulator RpfG family c-di-GMP phosphodiesterase